MRFKPFDVVAALACVIAIILSITAIFIGSAYVQAWLLLVITLLLVTAWVIRMIEIYKK